MEQEDILMVIDKLNEAAKAD